jgi:hypothetical protein
LNEQIKEQGMGGACIRQKRNVYRILVGNPEGKMPFGRLGADGE